jgi:hypothetical protein
MSGRSTLVARRSTGCAGSRSPSWAVRGPPRAVISNHTVFTPNLVQNVVIVIGASASRTYGVSTSVRGSPELFSRRSPSLIPLPSQTRQFGHKSNQTRCTGVYRIHRHKWDLTFSFLVGMTAPSTPRNCSSSTLVGLFFRFSRSSALPHVGGSLIPEQYRCNMSRARPSVRHLRHEVITLLCWPTRGSSCLAGSTDMTSLTTCIYSTSLPRRTSRKSQVSALTHNDEVPSPSQIKGRLCACITSLFSFSFFGARELFCVYCSSVDHIPTKCFVTFVLLVSTYVVLCGPPFATKTSFICGDLRR